MNLALFFLTLGASYLGGLVALKAKLPAARLVGGIMGVIALNVIYGQSYFYGDIKVIMQIVSGMMIGSGIGKKEVLELKAIIAPSLILIIGMMGLNVIFGGLIYSFSSLDITTSLFAMTPGGITDMALVAADLGANSTYVGILQVFRLLLIYLALPPIFKFIISRDPNTTAGRAPVEEVKTVDGSTTPVVAEPFPKKRFFLMMCCAIAVGGFCKSIGMVGGALTGAMLGSATYCVKEGRIKFPKLLKSILQVFAGMYIGSGVDRSCLMAMDELVIPLCIMTVGIFFFVFAIAFTIHRLTKLDIAICLLASTPGGITEMSLLSEELHADTAKIAIMQTARLVTVIMFFPTLLGTINAFFIQ